MKTIQRNKKAFIVAAVALFTAVCGFWLITAPSREREQIEDAQAALIQDILETPEPDLTDLEAVEFSEPLDYFYSPIDTANDADSEPGFEDAEEVAPITYTPIADDAFPSRITGIGILTIEAIDLYLPISEGIDEEHLRIAPGRVPQTAQVGDIGNAVIAGHRNYTYGEMFNRLNEIEIGTIIHYQARNGEMMEFIVFEIAEIEPNDQIAFIQPTSESIITLYTCTPIRVASHRLIIRAQRIN